MGKDKFTLLDENGMEREAELLNVITVDEQDYLLYSVVDDSDDAAICVAKIIYGEDGDEQLIDIEDVNEREKISKIIDELFDNFEGE